MRRLGPEQALAALASAAVARGPRQKRSGLGLSLRLGRLGRLGLRRLRLGLGFFGLGFGLCVTTRLWRPPPKNMGTIAERTRNGTATGPPASPKPKGRPGEAAFCLALFGLERRDAAGTRLAVGFRDPPRLCLLRARQPREEWKACRKKPVVAKELGLLLVMQTSADLHFAWSPP